MAFEVTDINKQLLFNYISAELPKFFRDRGFIEVHCQSNLTILAACEDPTTIGSFNYNGEVWPLPQTNQMNLEHILLKNPEYNGFFCWTTSYREEAEPVEGRHDKIFPMFEFESKGNMYDLIDLELDLCDYLGFKKGFDVFPRLSYKKVAKDYDTKIINYNHELRLKKDYGNVVFLEDFPEYTSPFWNMKRKDNTANKVDVIIHGMETIGSAEREVDTKIMKERFYTISDGKYAETIFAHFGKQRVVDELDHFLSLPMFPRFGGGIGITRLMNAFIEEDIAKFHK